MHSFYVRKRILVCINAIIEESHRGLHVAAKSLKINLPCRDIKRQIHGAQDARLKRQERLLPAGIGAFKLSDMRRRVCPVDPVYENKARVSGFPGAFNYLVKNILCLYAACYFTTT